MISQQQANYGRGDPTSHCGVCEFYLGKHRCSKVSGDISPYGVSKIFKGEVNPFGQTLSPREVQAIKMMASDAADRSTVAQMGSVAAPPR